MRIPTTPLLPAVIALLLAMSGAAQAQWKWRDSSGRITLSDLPPPHEIPDKDILQRPVPASHTMVAAPAASAPSAPQALTPVDKELEARRRAAEEEKKAQAQASADKLAQAKAQNCREARRQLATLQSGQRIARVNAQGEREFLDDAARAQEVQRANDVIASDCQ
ncbi:MAG: DUF4124 domain-containing protein [Burkholderiales bacterium]|nr:DUF4124 domain-containing protein [Burkholderiales bacterium]